MTNPTEKIFIDGMRAEAPRQGAPSFVKGRISVRVDEFIAFAKLHQTESGWLNIDVKESQKGPWYAELNTWKPDGQKAPSYNIVEDHLPSVDYPDDGGIAVDDIPF